MLKDRLKQLRIEKGKTQKEMAKDLGTTDVSIGRYEAGTREPKTDILNALADYFDVTTDYLLCRTDERKPNVKDGQLNKERFQGVNTISAHRIGDIEQLPEEALDQLKDYIELLKLKYKK